MIDNSHVTDRRLYDFDEICWNLLGYIAQNEAIKKDYIKFKLLEENFLDIPLNDPTGKMLHKYAREYLMYMFGNMLFMAWLIKQYNVSHISTVIGRFWADYKI